MTTPAKAWTNYQDRLGRVTEYIYDHLDEPIDLNRLADVACISAFHWHRIYHALHGETIAGTVKRLRLHRAAGYLVQTSLPIKEVARKAGYRNVQSFTRLFADRYRLPPAEYRKHGNHTQFQPGGTSWVLPPFSLAVRELPRIGLACLPHQGDYLQIDRTFSALFRHFGSRNQLTPDMRLFGVYYQDSSLVPVTELKSHAGLALTKDFEIDGTMELVEVGGGPHAILHYHGPYAAMHAAYQWLYGTWLPQSGREAADAPVFEEYLNDPRLVLPLELETLICLPLKS